MKTTPVKPSLRMRRFESSTQDPYSTRRKLRSLTVCPDCHAVFEKGHWRWRNSWPNSALEQACPACRRIRDRYPAGWLTLKGPFVKANRQEIIDIARNAQDRESAEHPLNRIMRIEDTREGLLITTTDIHLPRLIGEALCRAHKGQLRLRYDAQGYAVRVEWTQEAGLYRCEE